MKVLLSFAFTLFLCAITMPNLQAQTAETASVESTTAEATLTVKVKGVGCATDIKMIQTNVEKLDGVSKCTVVKKGATTSFDVVYVAEKVSEKEIHAAVEGTAGCENPNDRPYKVKIK